MEDKDIQILKLKERIAFLEGKVEGLEIAIQKSKKLPLNPFLTTTTYTGDPLAPKIT